MKNTIIIIAILLIIFGGSVYASQYLETSSREIVSKLRKLKNEIIMIEQNDYLETKDKANKMVTSTDEIYNKWKDIDKKWSVIIFHNEIDLIETSLISIKSSLEVEDYREVVREIDKSIFLLNHILEKEKINFKNIF